MSAIDIVFLVIVFILCVRAAVKGFLDEVFGFGAVIAGIFCAFYFMPVLSPHLESSMDKKLAAVLSFVILFAAVFLLLKIIQYALKSIFSGAILKSLDHGLGFIFGIAEGCLCVFIICFIMEILQPWIDTEALRKSSVLYTVLIGALS